MNDIATATKALHADPSYQAEREALLKEQTDARNRKDSDGVARVRKLRDAQKEKHLGPLMLAKAKRKDDREEAASAELLAAAEALAEGETVESLTASLHAATKQKREAKQRLAVVRAALDLKTSKGDVDDYVAGLSPAKLKLLKQRMAQD